MYMSRTESAISASGGLHTRPYMTSSATLPSANTPRTRLARDPVFPGATRPVVASDAPPSPYGGPVAVVEVGVVTNPPGACLLMRRHAEQALRQFKQSIVDQAETRLCPLSNAPHTPSGTSARPRDSDPCDLATLQE